MQKFLHSRQFLQEENVPADIVLFDMNESYTVSTDKLHGKSKNTPFKNMTLKGKVKFTILDGKIVFTDEA